MDYDYISNQLKIFAAGGLAEYTEFTGAVPTWTKSYTYLGDSELSTITPDGTGSEYIEFEHPDRLGTKLKTNQTGGTASEQAHLPFGKALNAESTITNNNKRFTSYDRSAATGLDYAVNRTYDSKQGRFTQVDPAGMRAVSRAAPQTLNLYAYCTNDPINHTDPSGLGFFSFLKKLFKWVLLVITVVAAVLTIVGAFVGVAAMAAFLSNTVLGQILGFIANIPGLIGSSIFGGTAGSIAGALGFTEGAATIAAGAINSMLGWSILAASKAAIGAINSFAQTKHGSSKGNCDFVVSSGGWHIWSAAAVSASGKGNVVAIGYSNGGVETRSGGSRAWRNNNPGNITPGYLPGEIGKAGGFTVFSSEAAGQSGITENLQRPQYQPLTIDGAVAKWAPPGSNDTARYQRIIQDQTGLSGQTVINTLSQGQLQSVANAIRVVEGWRVGTVTCQEGNK